MLIFEVLKIDFEELERCGYASITDYCRFLIAQGGKLPERIEVYRGEMLCLVVSDVALAATLEPTGTGWTKYSRGSSLKPRRSPAKPRGCVETK